MATRQDAEQPDRTPIALMNGESRARYRGGADELRPCGGWRM